MEKGMSKGMGWSLSCTEACSVGSADFLKIEKSPQNLLIGCFIAQNKLEVFLYIFKISF